ncbi:PstS family phosphate ABC transporter substrate-binding protein [Planomicrobium sp. YIM 101495]|uniref:PstS family phosphate ABC transporter substrate-binding protein n=1 Tax=Planomicrobium sp. YIM 101495 TaxID=2665160 RepID=UPI0012B775F8|nr:substrate-binding domain-containing protein [Planomicrobium sp. YIM 101495]MTD31262.1 hypothetical protein [Planomicrobium sp. YIM 101495]
MKLAGRIFITLLIGAFIAVLTLPVLLIVNLNGSVHWNGPIIAVAVSLLLLYIFSVTNMFARPKSRMIAGAAIIFCLLIGFSFAVPHFYKESFATVADDTDLYYKYQPFTDSEKLARLDGDASFQMEEPLPSLDGATALYPLYAAFTEAVYPEDVYEPHSPEYSKVISSTTPVAYDYLIDGTADIIFAAGPSEGQLKAAEEAGVELQLTPIGREAFVFFVNTKNPVEDLSSEEIRSIYSGETVNWSEVGGRDDDIRVFQRPEDSGSQTTFIKFMNDVPIMEPEIEEVASGMGGIIEEVASYRNHKNAIGYTFRFYANEMVQNDKIKLIAVDGVEPTIDTIRSGEYPMASEFYAITAGSDNPNIEPFLEWILSEEGQRLVEETGFVSVQ